MTRQAQLSSRQEMFVATEEGQGSLARVGAAEQVPSLDLDLFFNF